MQEGGRPVAVVDELHKRLEEQLVKCGRQEHQGFQGILVQTLEGELCRVLERSR